MSGLELRGSSSERLARKERQIHFIRGRRNLEKKAWGLMRAKMNKRDTRGVKEGPVVFLHQNNRRQTRLKTGMTTEEKMGVGPRKSVR